MNPLIIRKYDIRGRFGIDFDLNDVYQIGFKFADFLQQHRFSTSPCICVGYDGRISSLQISQSLIKGMLDAGVSVVKLGLCTSPMLYFATKQIFLSWGVMITASHNPAAFNGFKFVSHNTSFSEKEIKDFMQQSSDYKLVKVKGVVININVNGSYLQHLRIKTINNSYKKMKIIWDCSNGAMGCLIHTLINKLNDYEHVIINQEIDGSFPNHNPDPPMIDSLTQIKNAIYDNKGDLGIIFDGDGDRVVFLNSKGELITADHLMMIFSLDILQKYPQAKVIVDVKTSMRVPEFIKNLGGVCITHASGHSLIKNSMIKDEKVKFAAELSGHFFFSDIGFDDGLYAAIEILRIIAERGCSIEEVINSLPVLHITSEITVPIMKLDKFELLKNLKQILNLEGLPFSEIEGIKVNLKENHGWWLIRASNTQDVLTVRCEGICPETLCESIAEMKIYLKKLGITY